MADHKPIIRGTKFGRITVISGPHIETGTSGKTRFIYECRCDCGKIHRTVGLYLTNDRARSCGCGRGRIKHGHSDGGEFSHEYRTWESMRSRCLSKTADNYKDYGGRGIKICDRWRNLENGFSNFLADMGPRPKNTSLDRIDNDGNYEPSNCRWATPRQQLSNTRKNRFVQVNGDTVTVSEAARRLGISRQSAWHQLVRKPRKKRLAR